jgi:tRNA-splicing ligase RtcB
MDDRRLTVFGTVGEDIDHATVEQMQKMMSIDRTTKGALMPDAHVGYGMPIGGVIEMDEAISPSAVGYDIACRMHLTILDIMPEAVDDRLVKFMMNKLKDGTRFGVGAHYNKGEMKDHDIMYEPIWNALPSDLETLTFKGGNTKKLEDLAREQLGTSGAGNHFADILLGTWLESGRQFVALMTHSGSRGMGWQIAQKYMQIAEDTHGREDLGNGCGYLSVDENAYWDYSALMLLAGNYAKANHEVIHDTFKKNTKIGTLHTFDNHHNFAWENDSSVVHRKGATPAHDGEYGIIPGTSGSNSYLVRGLGNEASLNSSSHGAGRVASRKQSKLAFDKEAFDAHMAELGVLHQGIAPDEGWQAYKDIERVMEMQSDLVQPAAVMKPLVVVMGGGR